MECRINQLNVQNHKLRQDLLELKLRFGVPLDDEDRKFMDNLSSSSPNNGGYNDQHNNNNNTNNTDNTDNDNNSDGEMMKLSDTDCCMLSTTKSRNNSLSMDDSQNELIVKRDRLSPVSSAIPTVTPTPTPTPTPLPLSSSAPSSSSASTSMMTTPTPTTTNLFIPPSTIPNVLPSVMMPTPLSSSSLLPSVVAQGTLNGNQFNLTTESTVASNLPSVHTLPNNFLFSQLNSLDSTDLLTLKRIFSSLGVGCLPSTTSSSLSSSTSASPSVLVNQHTSSTPLMAAAAAAAAAVAAVASNGGVALPPLSPGGNSCLSNSVNNTTPTVVSFNSLTSLNTTAAAALLLRQAALIPPSTNPSSLPTHISTPLQQHQTTMTTTNNNNNNNSNSITSSGSNSINSDGQYENNSNLMNKLSISSPSPCILPLDSRCPSVHSVKSDPSNNSNDYLESPLDLSLCYSMKTENNNSDFVLSDSTITSDPMVVDKRYQDRRRRNNEAVRRCRENKRARMSGSCSNSSGGGIGSRGFGGTGVVHNSRTEVVAEKLQSENRCLRSELTGLSMEVKALRRLLSVGEELSQQEQEHEQEQEEQGNTPEASDVNNNNNDNNNNNLGTSTNHRNANNSSSNSSATVVSNGVTPDYFYSDTDDIQVTMMIPKKMRVKAIPQKLHQRFSLPPSPTPISTTMTTANSAHHHQSYQSYHHSNSNNMNDEDIDNYKIKVDESILNTENNNNSTHDGTDDKMVDERTTSYTSYVDNINSNNNDNDQLHCKNGKPEESIDYFKHVSSSSSSSSSIASAASSSSNSSDDQTNRIQQLSSSPSPPAMSDEYANNNNNEDNSTEEEKVQFSNSSSSRSSTIAIDDNNKAETFTPTPDEHDNQPELTIATTNTNMDGGQSISMPSNEIHLSNHNNNIKEENEKLVVIPPRGGGRKRTLKSSIHPGKISRSDPTSTTTTTTIPSTDTTTNISSNSNTIEEMDTSLLPVSSVHNIHHPVSTSPILSSSPPSPSGNTDDASYFIPSEKSVYFMTVDSSSSSGNPCAATATTTATTAMTATSTRNSGKGDSILT
ncbi:unnamed protein product [Trichobilharzia szidati]|nr:unnamed protein product [Trichobilharzia szidati]